VTARWVVDEVQPARGLKITWQPISLFFKNQPEPDSGFHAPTERTLMLLRVMEALRAAEGDDAVGRLYFAFGARIHHDGELDFDVAEVLTELGYALDEEIRTRMDAGLALTGDDVGTPIIAFDDRNGDRQGYFGPVITRVPPTEDALAMWDALVTMMNVQGFWELKRTRTERPEFGERPEL